MRGIVAEMDEFREFLAEKRRRKLAEEQELAEKEREEDGNRTPEEECAVDEQGGNIRVVSILDHIQSVAKLLSMYQSFGAACM